MKPLDLTGQIFGDLTVLELASIAPRRWLCKCVCGVIKEVSSDCLRGGDTKSCGCRKRRPKPKTGRHRCSEYKAWAAIKYRCNNIKNPNYGGRGITICDEWNNSYEAFLEHVGRKPSPQHSIDRIDNNRGYEPGNVRWATPVEQTRNRNYTSILTIDGVSKPLIEWANENGLELETLRRRVSNGWPEEVLLTPSDSHKSLRKRRMEYGRASESIDNNTSPNR